MNTESPNTASDTTESATGLSPMKKFGIPAGLLAGGVALGMAFAPVGLAGAQEDDTPDTPDSEAPADDADENEREGRGRHGRHGLRGGSEVVQELTGLTNEQLREGFAADQSLADQAAAAGVSQDDLVAAIVEEMQSRLADAVTEGRITQEQADERSAEIEERVAEAVTTIPSEREGRGGRGGRGHHGKFGGGFEVLEELGLTQEEVRAGFEAGNTLAETAAEQGITQDQLVDALVAQAMERADAAVESGRLTQAEADEKLADVEARITEKVTADPADRPERGRRGFGGFRGGNGPAGDTETTGLNA